MQFEFEYRPAESPLVEAIWRTQSAGGGSFLSAAASHLELVITKQAGRTSLTLRGPETRATPAPIPEDAEILGITFKLGTYMPWLPPSHLVDQGLDLPEAAGRSFWLRGSAWQPPDLDSADVFVARLVHEGILEHDPLVAAALRGETPDLSVRSLQRRFLRATGLTPKTLAQIERAHAAAALLREGVSILDTVDQTGYYDQPHMTRALKHLLGHTPAELRRNVSTS